MTTVANKHSETISIPSRQQQAAYSELWSSTYAALRQVHCLVCEGRIVLSGRVPTFHLKQVAQSLLQRRLGDELLVENCLEVAVRRCESSSIRESVAAASVGSRTCDDAASDSAT